MTLDEVISAAYCMYFSLLKIIVPYWQWWFHEEALTSTKAFYCTKGPLQWKKGSLDY